MINKNSIKKRCRKCNDTLPIDKFIKYKKTLNNGITKTYFEHTCTNCKNKRRRKIYLTEKKNNPSEFKKRLQKRNKKSNASRRNSSKNLSVSYIAHTLGIKMSELVKYPKLINEKRKQLLLYRLKIKTMPDKKACIRCGEVFPADKFRIRKTQLVNGIIKNRLMSYCIKCQKETTNNYARARLKKLKHEHPLKYKSFLLYSRIKNRQSSKISSVNLSDRYVTQTLKLKPVDVFKYPELIKVKRAQLLLHRLIKD